MYFLITIVTAVTLDLYQSIYGVYRGLNPAQRMGMAVKDVLIASFWPISLTILALAYVYHGQYKVIEYLNPHLTIDK